MMENKHTGVLLEVREGMRFHIRSLRAKAALIDNRNPNGELKEITDDMRLAAFSMERKYITKLDALIDAKPKGLDVGLMNAVKPADETEDRGEWALWCGNEHNAQAVLDAAKMFQEATTPLENHDYSGG